MSQSILSDVTNTPRDRYEAWAESYDERTARFQWSAPEFLIEAVVRYAPPKGFLRVLDIGVGTGQASVPYLEVGACVTGLDVSPSMLHQAKAKHPQFHALIEHDFNRPLTEAGLSAQSFDIVLSCGALHFARDLAQTLSELRWVLAPGGLVGFTYIPPQQRSFSSATTAHAPTEVEKLLQQLDFKVLEHESFVAYYDSGDVNDPVCYQRIVARCNQSSPTLPAVLEDIDRTACVDRSRLICVASQPLMRGSLTTQWTDDLGNVRKQNQLLVDALRWQMDAGEVEPRYLPLPKITATKARQGKPLCDTLVLMPHPDDESIYAGGTIGALTEAGYKVCLVVATDGGGGRGGSSSQLVTQRASELNCAAKILGIEQVETLGFVDFGKYCDRSRTKPTTAVDTLTIWGVDKTLGSIVSKIRYHRPRILLTLHPEVDPNYSLHGHHLGLGAAALVAFHLAADPGFILPDAPDLAPWALEEHHTMIPSHHSGCEVRRIEINRDRKLQAVQAHRTQQYSTQRLIAFLKSGKPEANFETLQILQARCCQTQLTAVSLSTNSRNFKNLRDWVFTYNSLRRRCYPRDALANLLEQQAQMWGASEEVFANIQKLRNSQTVAVVTGQQVGLFGGPVYTLYKALGAIKLARDLEAQGIPAVPVFWMASYDHDLDEVQQVKMFSGRSQPELLHLGLSKTHRPVGSTKLGLQIYSLLDELETSLENLPYTQEVLAALRAIYKPDTTFAEAFAGWLSYLTKQLGLIILDPAQREFATLARDIIARELFEGTKAALQQARQVLAATGRSEIIPTDRDVLQMFYTDADGIRRRMRRVEGGFALQPTNVCFTHNAMRNILEQEPERFTPSALLRPLCQDAVLPTIAYVAGPTEQQYFTQLTEVYAWASIPMPQIVARPSFTVMDNNTAYRLSEAGGAVSLLNSSDAHSRIGRAGLPVAVRCACDELSVLQQRCFKLQTLARANQPIGDGAIALKQDIELWLAATAPIIQSWGAIRPWKALTYSQTELLSLAASVSLDLQRSGRRGYPPSTRNTANLSRKLASLKRTILREGRRHNPLGVAALSAIAFNGILQERHLCIAELIATHGVSIVSHLLPISEPDFNHTRVITVHQG
ncbi:MAG: bacillithiol biosynthesis cysteine-adding enzyme BshC [Scytonema sp. PMC 1069.18]|nr:bacillithiol biosynthesis cysteine-adding enzyme BshC [Scytonema sp. PMC 1069.18]MEC4884640.1 bacillithiol biosynthesis cysteine-adding enzyme BshC [Scytonema sp. PMC 1070.18]